MGRRTGIPTPHQKGNGKLLAGHPPRSGGSEKTPRSGENFEIWGCRRGIPLRETKRKCWPGRRANRRPARRANRRPARRANRRPARSAVHTTLCGLLRRTFLVQTKFIYFRCAFGTFFWALRTTPRRDARRHTTLCGLLRRTFFGPDEIHLFPVRVRHLFSIR